MSAYEYSYSDGQYWSKYNHCRVWENGTYKVKVKDENGQIAEQDVVIDYNEYTLGIPLPPIISAENYEDNTWTSNDVVINITTPEDFPGKTLMRYSSGETTVVSPDTITLTSSQVLRFIVVNPSTMMRSPEAVINVLITKEPPSNLVVDPTIIAKKRIDTAMSAIDQKTRVKYSISYDDGATWSTPQIGKKFSKDVIIGDTFKIKGRAYNEAGLYIESDTIEITV